MITLELIATSVEDCVTAQEEGAQRIELTTALPLGGLTPSLGLLVEARLATALPIMAMVRPRSSGFCYSASDFATMLRDAELLLAHGADGIVFGVLQTTGAIDLGRAAQLVALAAGRQTVFHRAFDVTPDPIAALEQLIDLGVTRVLTSGQEANAYNGAATIKRLRDHAAGRIEILPGGGINRLNVADVLARTGCTQVHLSLSGSAEDPSVRGRPQVIFGSASALPEDSYRVASRSALVAMRRQLNELAGASGAG